MRIISHLITGRKAIISAIFFHLFTLQVMTQNLHYYIYSKNSNTSFGKYHSSNDRIIKEKAFNDLNSLLEDIDSSGIKVSGLLFYIHGFMADNTTFEEKTGKILQTEIFDSISSNFNIVVSLKWKADLDYRKSFQIALDKGKQFSQYVEEFYNHFDQNIPVSMICHSMGNRVFEGLFTTQELSSKPIKLKHVLMFAPDLESNIFNKNLMNLSLRAEKAIVFYNADDKTLKGANILVPYRRLGIYGIDETESHKVLNISTTGLKDNKGLAPNFSLHRYYYSSPSIRKAIVELLNGKSTIQLLGATINVR